MQEQAYIHLIKLLWVITKSWFILKILIVNKKDFIDIFETEEVEKFCRTEAKGIKPQQSTQVSRVSILN